MVRTFLALVLIFSTLGCWNTCNDPMESHHGRSTWESSRLAIQGLMEEVLHLAAPPAQGSPGQPLPRLAARRRAFPQAQACRQAAIQEQLPANRKISLVASAIEAVRFATVSRDGSPSLYG